ncbi:MAG: DUF922 domain-containing protein [Chitinophagaceae bacterium]
MRKILFISLALWPLFCLSQDKGEELVFWTAGQRLTWTDYKGKADPSTGAAASTATFLGIDYTFSPKGLTYTITCSFSKTRSWGLHKNEYILQHEQGHFDIAEIFARKLNMKMATYKFNKSTYKTDLQKIYDDVVNEKEETQNAYDKETDHSIKKDKQAEWLNRIEKMLKEYEGYASY